MLIRSFGLFWRASEVNWKPGQGRKDEFRLLGRRGTNNPGVRLADFRYQQGIYVLYDDYGAYYVGLTRKQGLGKRLRDHLADKHAGHWDRFSWFGFCTVLKPDRNTGICPLRRLAELSVGSPGEVIADMEALLIKAVGPLNAADMKFKKASQWIQVERDEAPHYLDKVRRR